MKNARRAGRRKQRKTRRTKSNRRRPVLQFTPSAWAKLLFLRDLGETEVGGFGISSPDRLLLVEDVKLVRQRCTAFTVQFDDAAVADFFDDEVDQGHHPERFARIWLHTHPGDSPTPSGTDEETFRRCFGRSDWAVMFILARGGQTYARLRFRAGPGGSLRIPVGVDYQRPFPAADHAAWEQEYLTTVQVGETHLTLDWEDPLDAWDLGLALDGDAATRQPAFHIQPHQVKRRNE